MKEKKNKKLKMLLSIAFLIALMVLTFYIIFKDNSLNDIYNAVKEVDLRYIGIAVLMAVGFIVFQALALKIPVRSLGVKKGMTDYLGFSFVGFYFSGITPSATGGQPMQLYYMRRHGIAVSDATLGLLVTNIAYQIVIMLYGVVMLILRFSFVSQTVSAMTALIIYGYLIAGIVLLGLIFVMFSKKFSRRVVHGCIKLLGKIRIVKDVDRSIESADRQIDDYTKGADVIRRSPGLFIKVLLTTVAQMTCYFLVPFFIYKSFGLSGHSVMDLIAVQAILFIAVSYLPLPGSVGASEKGFVTMFSSFFPSDVIVPAMLLSRGITFYLLMIVSGIVTAVMHLRTPKEVPEKEQQESGNHALTSGISDTE